MSGKSNAAINLDREAMTAMGQFASIASKETASANETMQKCIKYWSPENGEVGGRDVQVICDTMKETSQLTVDLTQKFEKLQAAISQVVDIWAGQANAANKTIAEAKDNMTKAIMKIKQTGAKN